MPYPNKAKEHYEIFIKTKQKKNSQSLKYCKKPKQKLTCFKIHKTIKYTYPKTENRRETKHFLHRNNCSKKSKNCYEIIKV